MPFQHMTFLFLQRKSNGKLFCSLILPMSDRLDRVLIILKSNYSLSIRVRWWTLVSLVRWMDWQCTNSKKSVPWELTGCTVLHVIIVLQNLRHSLSFSCSTLKFQIMTWSAAVTFFMYFSNSPKFVPIIFFTSFVFATHNRQSVLKLSTP